jgi:hypothetical protein
MSYSPGMTSTTNSNVILTEMEQLRGADPRLQPWISLDVPRIPGEDPLYGAYVFGTDAFDISKATGGFVWYCADCNSWAVVDSEWEARLMRDAHRTALLRQYDQDPEGSQEFDDMPLCVEVIVNVSDRLVRYAFV